MVRLDVAINLLFHFGFVLVLVADVPDLRERFGCNPDFPCSKTGFRHECCGADRSIIGRVDAAE